MPVYLPKASFRRILALLALLNVLFTFFGVSASAETEPTVSIRVTIEHVWTLLENCDSPGIWSECDFYTKIKIGEQEWQSGTIDNNNSIYPDWRFTSEEISISQGSVPVSIKIYDSDVDEDDHIDIVHGDPDEDDKDLLLTVDLVPCSISSNALIHDADDEDFANDSYTGACDTVLYTESYSGGRSGVLFKIEVLEPSYGTSLGVRCLQKPVWPQPGETVTIYAEALTFEDGTLQPRISDSIEIWVNDNTKPYHIDAGTETSVTFGPLTGDSFTYNCRVIDDGLVRSSGWRQVAVGSNLADKYEDTVPVYYSGGRKDSLDILFHPETESYEEGASDKSFSDDIFDMIWNSFFTEEVFLENQMNLNFWITKESIRLHESALGRCIGEPGYQRAWSDENAVVHRLNCWDQNFQSTWGNFTTMKHDAYRVMLHESAHALFNLSDEYECTGNCRTFFTESWPFPNVYKSEEYCRKDAEDYPYEWGDGICEQNALKLERDPDLCRGFLDADGRTWWTSDPPSDDLMLDLGRIQKLDKRRIEWIFCHCRNGDC